MPTALVTGIAGFIGSNLAGGLLDRGYNVRGIDKARQMLDYDPEVPFDDGLKRTIEYYRDD